MGKKLNFFGFKLDDEDAAILRERAGGNVSAWVRGTLRASPLKQPEPAPANPPAPTETAEAIEVDHIDDLGDDPLRADTGALAR